MIEIIPNWHPFFVHFTVALFTSSVFFYLLFFLTKPINVTSKTVSEFEVVGRWCLWFVTFITIFTVAAGFYAYYTVKHDEISHVVMTTHRNLALATSSGILLMALWSWWCYRRKQDPSVIYLIGLLIVEGLLLSTAWYGGELVYRHGIGVLTLPQEEEVGHHHSHEIEKQKNTTDSLQHAHGHREGKHEH